MNSIPDTPAKGFRQKPVPLRQVVQWITERIRDGELVPGQRLIEIELMQEIGASRARVREAFQRLETEGLVTIEEFRGASVRRFGQDEIHEIYRTRMALEGMAAHDFATFGDPAEKEKLAELQCELDEAEAANNHEHFAIANDAWHRLIVAGARNRHLSSFIERLRVPAYRLIFRSSYAASRIEIANDDHRQISHAIIEGRATDAERLMRQHIASSLAAIFSAKDGRKA